MLFCITMLLFGPGLLCVRPFPVLGHSYSSLQNLCVFLVMLSLRCLHCNKTEGSYSDVYSGSFLYAKSSSPSVN